MNDYAIDDMCGLYRELDTLICDYMQYEDPANLKEVNKLISFLWGQMTDEEKFRIIHN